MTSSAGRAVPQKPRARAAKPTPTWLPEGKIGAVCFSVDDVHPARTADGYDAGGDLGAGVLGRVERLLERHAQLHTTLFVTPDWRPKELVAKVWRARLPLVAERIHQIDLHADGRYRLDRHPEFVRYLGALPRTDAAPHGLHHAHRGSRFTVEFQRQDAETCISMLRQSLQIFAAAGVCPAPGFSPPGWNLPEGLATALTALGLQFVSSARDIRTPLEPGAVAQMSGLRNVSLLEPERLGTDGPWHIPVNFQATSTAERAYRAIECGGVLSIKAHAFKHAGGHTMIDGLDADYFDYLDRLFRTLESRYGDGLWWTSMSAIAAAAAAGWKES